MLLWKLLISNQNDDSFIKIITLIALHIYCNTRIYKIKRHTFIMWGVPCHVCVSLFTRWTIWTKNPYLPRDAHWNEALVVCLFYRCSFDIAKQELFLFISNNLSTLNLKIFDHTVNYICVDGGNNVKVKTNPTLTQFPFPSLPPFKSTNPGTPSNASAALGLILKEVLVSLYISALFLDNFYSLFRSSLITRKKLWHYILQVSSLRP